MKQSLGFKSSSVLSQRGMSLVEVMIVVMILSLIGIGTSSLLKNIVEVQRRNAIKSAMSTVRDALRNTLNNDTAWNNTIESYPLGGPMAIACLRDIKPDANFCTNGAVANNFDVRDGSLPIPGAVFYGASVATAGFNPAGVACNTYNAGAGDDLCPYRYDLTATLECPDGLATCPKPQVLIQATFRKNALTKGSPVDQINPSEFDFQIRRGEKLRYEPVTLRFFNTTGGVAGGGGPCAGGPAASSLRPVNQVINDVGGNVTTGALPATQFTLAAGIYDCDISAQVFDLPAGFSLVFRNTAGTLSFPIGSGFTQSGTSATVNAKARFNITAPTSFQLQQFCPNAPADANNPFRMGIPTESYAAGNIFTQITCVRNR